MLKTPFSPFPIITQRFTGPSIKNLHPGIDLIPCGQGMWPGITHREASVQNARRMRTKILACLGGDVVFTDYMTGAGNTVIIDSAVDDGILRQVYCHLNQITTKKNESIVAGETIGLMGNTGCRDIHLHFTLIHNPKKSIANCFSDDNLVDPLKYFDVKYISKEGIGLFSK